MNVTLDALTRDLIEPEVIPEVVLAGGTLNGDFALQLTALMNRVSTLEKTLNEMNRQEVKKDPEPEVTEVVEEKSETEEREETDE